jgi:hypothetical protein
VTIIDYIYPQDDDLGEYLCKGLIGTGDLMKSFGLVLSWNKEASFD